MVSQAVSDVRHGRPWTRPLVGTPIVVPASGTVTQVLELAPSDRAIVLLPTPSTNVSSLSVTGTGSGTALLPALGTTVAFPIGVPVFPAIDDHVTVTCTAKSAGSVVIYVAALDATAADLLSTYPLGGNAAVSGAIGLPVAAFNFIYDAINAEYWNQRNVQNSAANAPYTGVTSTGVGSDYASYQNLSIAGTAITGTTAAAPTTLLALSSDVATKKRYVYIASTCNQAIHLIVRLTPTPAGSTGNFNALDLPINIGSTNTQKLLITRDGVFANDAASTVNALTSGNAAALDAMANSFGLFAYAGTTPTTGSLFVDVVRASL